MPVPFRKGQAGLKAAVHGEPSARVGLGPDGPEVVAVAQRKNKKSSRGQSAQRGGSGGRSSKPGAAAGPPPGEFISLCLVAMSMVLGNSMLIPVLPAMVESLDISNLQAGLNITAFSIAAGVTIPIAGFLSDHVGRKKVMAPSLFLYGLAGVAGGIAGLILKEKALTTLLIIRAVQGIGAGGTFQIAMALTGDLFTKGNRTKALGTLEASNGLGKVIAPLVGASLAALVWFAPFFVYAVAIPIAILVWVVVKEPPLTQRNQSFKKYMQGIGEVFSKKALPLTAIFLAGMLVLFFYFGVLSYLSDFLEERLHVKGVKLGLIIAIPVFVMALTSFLSGQVLAKKKPGMLKWATTAGLAFGGVMLALAGTTKKEFLLVGFISVLGVGNGVVLPSLNALTTSCTIKAKRGTLTSLYGAVRHVGAATGPPAVALLIKYGHRATFWVLAGLAIAAALFAAFFLNTQVLLKKSELGGQGSAGGGQGQAGIRDEGEDNDSDSDNDGDDDDGGGWRADIP